MEQVYHRKKSNSGSDLFSNFSFISLVLLLNLLNFNLKAQSWIEIYSDHENHSAPLMYSGGNTHFFLVYSADGMDYERRVNNLTGASISEKNLGASIGRIIKMSNGDFLKIGVIDQQIQAIRLNVYGNVVWTKTYSTDPFPFALTDDSTIPDAIELPSGDLVIMGSGGAPAPFSTQGMVIRIKPNNGDIVWQKFINGIGRANVALGLFPAFDGGVFIQGLAALGSSNAGQFLIKMDDEGNTLWREGPNFHPTNSVASAFSEISPTDDGGIAYRERIGEITYLRKLDKDGEEVWTNESTTHSLRGLQDGSLIVFELQAEAEGRIYRLAVSDLDATGHPNFTQKYNVSLSIGVRFSDISFTINLDGSLLMVGSTSTPFDAPFSPNGLFTWRLNLFLNGCERTSIEGGVGEIAIKNLTAPIEIVEVYDQNWQQIFRCQGTDCGSEQIITSLSVGKYYVKVQFYDANWQSICRLDNVEVEVISGGGCPPGYCEGDIDLFSQSAIDAFCGCKVIRGDLVIRPSEGTINSLLPLAGLRKVEGNLIIDGAVDLVSLDGLEDLEMTGEDFVLNNTRTLSDIGALAKLNTIGDLLAIEGCEELGSLAAMLSLNAVGRIGIQVCPKLMDINIFSNIIALKSLTLTLTGLKNLEGLKSLETIGEGATFKNGLSINGNRQLTALEGLNNLSRVEGPVSIAGNSVLTNLNALQNLRFIDNREGSGEIALLIRQNEVLSDCCGITRMIDEDPTNGQIFGGEIVLEDNPAFCSSVAEILANCQDPPIASCDDVVIQGGDGEIKIFGLNAPIEIVEVYDPNWNLVFRCQGTDCGSEQMISGLSEGRHFVKVQFYDENWKWICGLGTIEVEVGGPSTGNCDAANIQGGNGELTISGLSAPNVIVDVFDINWNGVFRCVGQECEETEVISSLNSGTYRVNIQFFEADWNPICRLENVLVEVGSNGTPSCDDVVVSADNGALDIAGLTAPIEIVRIFDLDNHYQQVFECIGDCEDSQTISGLTSQNYLVKVQMYNNNWSWICERNFEFTFGEAGSRAALSQMMESQKLFSISPNPARDEIYLDTRNLKNKLGTIQIFNTYGHLMKEMNNQDFTSFRKAIAVHELENGLYFLNIRVEGLSMITKRFVIESRR